MTVCDLQQLKEQLINPVLTIGNFDGVHKGHLTLFDMVKERALNVVRSGLPFHRSFKPKYR